MSSPHVTSLINAEPTFANELGSVILLDSTAFPILNGLSIKRLVLEAGAIREPQWNVNANQIAYCIRGTVLVSMLGNANEFTTFVVGPGQMYHVASGSVYHVENIGDRAAELVLALRSDRPLDFSLKSSVNAMTNAVLANTYDIPASSFEVLDRGASNQIVRRNGNAHVPDNATFPNAHLFAVENQNAPVQFDYGHARTARKQFWAALEDISMYSLQLTPHGMREPHWHPITAEMGYVTRGHGRMRVLDPDGTLDEYLLEPGDVYFVPRAYPHHIETMSEEQLQFQIFFDQAMPGDIGYRATASAFSREVLAASFGIPERELPTFPVTGTDPLIVPRRSDVLTHAALV